MTSEELAGLSLVIIAVVSACALLHYGGDQSHAKEIGLFNNTEEIPIERRSTTPDERMQELRRDCFSIAVIILTVAVIWFVVVPRP